ncbi:MFS transporter [Levilactobacillus brevis]|nr:MFS transporter [Levilactobacillus brevis]
MDETTEAQPKKYSVMMKTSLLSVSIILTSGSAIAATIPSWLKAFPNVARSNVELLQTLPSISVVFATLLSTWVAKWIGVKRTVIVGLLIAGFSGITPALVTSYGAFFASRLMLGVGFGLVNSYAVSMIGMFFSGHERSNLMGYRSSCEKLGSSLTTYVAGILLVSFNWHAAFWVYGLAFLLTILFAIYVPEPSDEAKAREAAAEGPQTKEKQRVNGKVVFWTIFCILYLIPIIASYTRITEYVTTNHYLSLATIATALSLAQFAGILTGIIFGPMLRVLKFTFEPITIALTGVAQLMIALSTNAWIIGTGVILTSMISGVVVAYVFNLAADVAPKNSLNLATSLMIVGCNIGTFVTPLVLGWIGMFHSSSDLGFTFLFFGWILVIVGILMLFVIKPLSAKVTD